MKPPSMSLTPILTDLKLFDLMEKRDEQPSKFKPIMKPLFLAMSLHYSSKIRKLLPFILLILPKTLKNTPNPSVCPTHPTPAAP